MSTTNRIVLSKIGSEHIFQGVNNQDFCISLPNAKIVLDGCGSCDFSDVGTRLFGQLLLDYSTYLSRESFEKTFEIVVKAILLKILKINDSDKFLFDNLCFTILACFETGEEYVVFSCGDGYILVQDTQGIISPIELDDGEYPKYFAYNLVKDKDSLHEYKEGVKFTITRFSKSECTNVGVATDGFRYYEALGAVEKNKLFDLLAAGKKGQIGMLINRNSTSFKDDITICF